jgi:hypothetical protein
MFTIGPLPDGNVFQAFGLVAPAGTTTPSVQDGFYLMLAPLSRGNHTLHFHARFPGTPDFVLDITYNLTVLPGGRGGGGDRITTETHGTWGSIKTLYR